VAGDTRDGTSAASEMNQKTLPFAALLVVLPLRLLATERCPVPMNFVDETAVGASAGRITVTESAYGLVFTPELTGLPAGLPRIPRHENPSCLPGEKDGRRCRHSGPEGISTAEDGQARLPVGRRPPRRPAAALRGSGRCREPARARAAAPSSVTSRDAR